jgi:hypothetical protein
VLRLTPHRCGAPDPPRYVCAFLSFSPTPCFLAAALLGRTEPALGTPAVSDQPKGIRYVISAGSPVVSGVTVNDEAV